MTKKTLLIDGGLGRVITAIPALEKFVKQNPETNIVTYGWTPILWGNRVLKDFITDNMTKGLLEKIRHTKIIKPEPYFNSDYINGKINLADAWNQEINNDQESMPLPQLFLSSKELKENSKFKTSNNTKVIAFQPFGSSAIIGENSVEDNSFRSLNIETTKYLVNLLRKEGYLIYLMVDKMIPFLRGEDFINHYPPGVRDMAATVANVDYFLGIDSCGQHIARCFKKPGSVIIGATNPVNISYPNHYNLLNYDKDRTYMPYRIAEFDWWLGEIENSTIMEFNQNQLKEMGKNILEHIKKSFKG